MSLSPRKLLLLAIVLGSLPATSAEAARPIPNPAPPATIVVDPWYGEEPHPWAYTIGFVVTVTLDPKRQGAFVSLDCFLDDGTPVPLYIPVGPPDYDFPLPDIQETGYCTARLMIVTSQGGNRPGIVTYPAEVTFATAPFEVIVIP